MSAGSVSIIGLVNPAVGTLLGVAFAHEVFGPVQALGMVLVLGGVLVGQRFGQRSEPAGRRTSGAGGGRARFSSVRPPEGNSSAARGVGNWYDPDSEPDPERRQHHPPARLRCLPGPAGGHRPDHRTGPRGRLPAHRHRRDVRQREGCRRGDPRLRDPARRAVRHQQAQQRLPRARRGAQGLRPDARRPRPRPGRPVPDPLAAAHASTTATSSPPGRRSIEFKQDGRARSIGVSNFQPAHLERLAAETDVVPAVNQIEVHPYFTNEAARAASRDAGILVEAWSPIAQGGVLDDPAIVEDRRARRPYAGPGDPALAPPARRHRLPEVLDAGADGGERRAVRLRARRPGDGSRSARSTVARTAAPARTRTSSTTSPAEVPGIDVRELASCLRSSVRTAPVSLLR